MPLGSALLSKLSLCFALLSLSLSLISVAVVDVVSRHWCWLVVAVVVDGVDFVVVIAVALVVVAVSLVVVASSSV